MNNQNVRRDTRSCFTINPNRNSLSYWIKVIFVIFKVLGLAPLSIGRPSMVNKTKEASSKSVTTVQFSYSGIGNLYNVFLVVLLSTISFVSLPILCNVDYPFKTKLSSTIEVSVTVCYDAAVIAICLLMCTDQNTMVNILHRLTKVDSSLAYLTADRNSESSWCYFFLLYLMSIVLCSVIAVTDQLCYGPPIIILISNSVPNAMVYWFIIQYVSVLKLFENRFQALGRALLNRSVSSNRQIINSSSLDDISIDKSHYPKVIMFRRAHTELYEITCEVSQFYSLPILLAIAVSSFSIIYSACCFFLPLFAVQTQSEFICTTANAAFNMAGLCLPIIMLTAGVNRTKTEMRKIADVTHKLLERPTTSQEDKVELQQFSIKLLLPNDHFTAYKLFSLDGTLLHSIFSMVVTYLIILCQLQLSTVKRAIHANSTDAPN